MHHLRPTSILQTFAFVLSLLLLPAGLADGQEIESHPKLLRIIAFGGHPDDAEYQMGGCAIKWAQLGHKVKLVSLTNGDIGHFELAGGPLARRRTEESREAAKRMGVESLVLDNHDGELMPTLANRKVVARLIRQWQADIVLTHWPYDYHPDHRNGALLVRDAAFLVRVTSFVLDTLPLERKPVCLYFSDNFKRPYPFQADIVVSIDDVFDRKVAALDDLVTQAYENYEHKFRAPLKEGEIRDPELRKRDLRKRWFGRNGRTATNYRESLVKWYGAEKGESVETAEAFEICEYGRQPSEEELKELFPFFND